MRIASETWHWTVYRRDDLILGLDLLKYMHTVVDLASNTVVVGSEMLEANTRTNPGYGTYSSLLPG